MDTSNQVVLPLGIEQRPNAVLRNGGPQLLRGLVLPLPPSKNNWHHPVSKGPLAGRMLLTKEARAYKNTIAELAMIKRFRFGTDKPLKITVLVCPRDKRVIDCHNYTGQLFDALQEAHVFEDDNQLEEVSVLLGPVFGGGRIFVSLWTIEPNKQALLSAAMRGEL